MQEKQPMSEVIKETIDKVKSIADTKTVIGDPITTPDGVTILPVTKVSIGYASGGSDFTTKNTPANRDNPFGGGAGGSVKITPIAFLVIRDGNVRMLPVAEPASTSMDRLVEQLPDILDRVDGWLSERKEKGPAGN